MHRIVDVFLHKKDNALFYRYLKLIHYITLYFIILHWLFTIHT